MRRREPLHATFCRSGRWARCAYICRSFASSVFHALSFAPPYFYNPPPASTRRWVALSCALVVHFVAASALVTIAPQSRPVAADLPIEVRLLGLDPASPERPQSDITTVPTPVPVHEAQAPNAPIPQPVAQISPSVSPSVSPHVISVLSASVASPAAAAPAGVQPVALSESGQEAGNRGAGKGGEPAGGSETARPKTISPLSEPLVEARFDAAYLTNPRPIYPAMSRRLGESGVVHLRVEVDAEGQALQVEVKSSSGYPRLDRAAQEAVSGWRFIPARRGKLAVVSWVVVPINYSLN